MYSIFINEVSITSHEPHNFMNLMFKLSSSHMLVTAIIKVSTVLAFYSFFMNKNSTYLVGGGCLLETPEMTIRRLAEGH